MLESHFTQKHQANIRPTPKAVMLAAKLTAITVKLTTAESTPKKARSQR
ncbi:hypothetical protein VIH_003009 [Vibrio cholerae CT 5369-93]|nr:hypothetical protein VIH_003009 [Vibrio cholerae CT 5369-93]